MQRYIDANIRMTQKVNLNELKDAINAIWDARNRKGMI